MQPAATHFPMLYPLLAFCLLLIQSVVLSYLINNKRMMHLSNYLTGMAYMIITSLFPEWNYFSAPLLVNTFLILILSALLKSYNFQQVKGILFNAGLAAGAALFLYFPAISIFVWMLLSMLVMRPFRISEWIICLLGFLTPFYFYSAYLFLSDSWNWMKLVQPLTFRLPAVTQSAWLAGSTFLLAVSFLSGAYFVQNNMRKMLIQVRKGWSLLLLLLLASLFVPFISSTQGFENWMLAAVPLAAFHACSYQYFTFRIIPNLLFWLSVVFIIAYQYSGPGW